METDFHQLPQRINQLYELFVLNEVDLYYMTPLGHFIIFSTRRWFFGDNIFISLHVRPAGMR